MRTENETSVYQTIPNRQIINKSPVHDFSHHLHNATRSGATILVLFVHLLYQYSS